MLSPALHAHEWFGALGFRMTILLTASALKNAFIASGRLYVNYVVEETMNFEYVGVIFCRFQIDKEYI